MATTNVVAVLNAIRQVSKDANVQAIGEVTQANIRATVDGIADNPVIMNSVLDTLMDVFCSTQITSKLYNNKLAKLKTEKVPFGNAKRLININPAKGKQFDPDGKTTLARDKEIELQTVYLPYNVHKSYKRSISEDDFRTSFSSDSELKSFTQGLITSLYGGANKEEYETMIYAWAQAIEKGYAVPIYVKSPFEDPTGFSKAIQTISKDMEYYRTCYNGYAKANPATGGEEQVVVETFTPKEDQLLILRDDVDIELVYSVLAPAFNMSKVQLDQMTVTIDSFGDDKVYAMLVDKAFNQFRNYKQNNRTQYNAEGEFTNLYMHVKEGINISLLSNAVAFVDESKKQTV